jgi:predicted DNA-binding transcriptional regulator YafY
MTPQKSRLLFLLELLTRETDEQHPMTIADMEARLAENGMTANWKTIKSDIALLIDNGVDVVCNKGRELQYFIGDRQFELPELKLLTDAVLASRFISFKKSKQLIEKLTALTSIHQAGELNRHLHIEKYPKPDNEQVFYTVDLLNTAINAGRKVAFKYYEYDGQKRRIFKHNRQTYLFSPYGLVWNNDCYYALGFSDSHGKIITFRIDRIAAPALSDQPAVPKPSGFDISVYTRSVFQMFDGSSLCDVVLKCENSLMKSVIDRFGKGVETAVLDDEHFRANVCVSPSPTFFGWVLGFAGKMKIASPKDVKEEFFSLLCSVADRA